MIATAYVDAVREAIELDHLVIVLKLYPKDELAQLRAFVHPVMMNGENVVEVQQKTNSHGIDSDIRSKNCT